MASIFACWLRLRAACAPLSHLDVEGDIIPMLTAFNSAYAELRATRADIEAQYLEFKKHKYLTIRGGSIEGHFRPNDLPLAKTLPTIKDAFDAESKSSPPAQRALVRVVQHRRWLACIEAAHGHDKEYPHVYCKFREATRFIAISQPGAGMALDI